MLPASLRGGSFLRRLLRDSVLAGLAAGFSRLFVFLLSLWVSRSSGSTAEFGLFSSSLLIVQLGAMLAGLGVAQTAAQSIAARTGNPDEQGRAVRTLTVISFGAAAIGGFALLLLNDRIAQAMGRAVPADLIRWTAVLLFLQLLVGGIEGVLRGLRRFRALPVATFGGLLVSGGIAAWPGVPHGAHAGLLALGAFLAVQCALMLLALRRYALGPVLPFRSLVSLTAGIALPTFLAGLFWNLAMLFPPLLLVRLEHGLEEIAVWNACGQLRTLISFAPVIIVNASIPHLVERMAAGRLSPRQTLVALGLPLASAFAPYLSAVAFARPLLSMYGQTYGEHTGLLLLVLTYVLLQVLGVGLFGVVLASGRIWKAALLNIVWCVIVIGLAPKTINAFGSTGLAALYLGTYVPVDAVLALLAIRAVRGSRNADVQPAAELCSAPSTRPQ